MQRPFLNTVLEALEIPCNPNFVKKLSEEEPFANSIFGLSAMLRRYNVPNECLKFDNKEDILEYSGFPIVVIYKGEFGVVSFNGKDSLSIRGSNGHFVTLKTDEFLDNWDGVALIPSPDEESKEPDYSVHRRDRRISLFKHRGLIVIAAFMVLLAIAANSMAGQWMWWCVLLIDLAATGVCFMLLQKDLNIHNRFADKICGLAKESHCEDVTKSDGGTLLGLFKLSEVGFTYFAVNSIFLLLYPASIPVMALTAVLVLPFSFWSVWYQKFKVKSWCVLCLCSLAAMWLQALMFLLDGQYSHLTVEVLPALWLIAAYGLTILLVDRAMTFVRERMRMKYTKKRYDLLKYDTKVINAILDDKSVIDVSDSACSSIVFGNPDADSQITVFSNPYCSPCAEMHEHIKDLPGSTVGVRYVFTYFSDDKSDINRYIIAAYRQLGAVRTWQLLTQWYDGGKKSGKEFFAGMGLDPDAPEVIAEFKKHSKWRQDDRLVGTPTIIVNSRILDRPYTIDDYPYLQKIQQN